MTTNLDRFVRANIKLSGAVVSQRGFGTPMFVAYHNAWSDRVRLFTSPDDVLAAGMDALHPLYLAALSFCSQDDHSPEFKIGKRLGKPTQKMRFTPSTPAQGDVYSFTVRGVTFFVTAPSTPTVANITAAFATLLAANATAIIASGVASATSAQDIAPASYNGTPIGAGVFPTPRNIEATFNSSANWLATTLVVTGLDAAGRVQQENIAIPSGGGSTVVGSLIFSQITNVHIPTQGGTGGTLELGVGTKYDTGGKLVITCTDNTTSFDVTDTNAGDWFGYDDVSANLGIEDRSTDDGSITLTADLAAIKAADADFYAMTVEDAGSAALIELASAWAESQVIEYFAQSADSADETTDLAGIAYSLKNETRVRTCLVHTRANHRRKLAAGILGVVIGQPVGSTAYQFKQVSGCVPDAYGDDVIVRLCGPRETPSSGKRALIYISAVPTGTNSGTPVTIGGMSAAGLWLEVVAGVDASRADMQATIVNRQLASPKIPFTERGAHAIEGDVFNVLVKYAKSPYGLYDESTIATTHVPIASVSSSDKQNRYYRGGVSFAVTTQGAMGAIDISGNVVP